MLYLKRIVSVKSLYTILATTLCTLLLMSIVGYSSCTKDYCKYVVCQNGGTCNNGDCVCNPEFTGARCERLTCVVNNTGRLHFNNVSDTSTYLLYVDGNKIATVKAGVLAGPFALKVGSHTYRAVDSARGFTRCSQNVILKQCEDVYMTCGK